MPTLQYRPAEALDKIEGISDSPHRELYVDRHELVTLSIEFQNIDSWRYFNKLDCKLLPRLPHGYRWVRVDNKHAVIRDKMVPEHKLLLVLYGPDEKKKVNFIFQVDDVTTYGFAHTRNTKSPERNHPMGPNDFRVPGFDYATHEYAAHVQGHVIDQKDTITQVAPKSAWSAFDSRNFIPEPPDYHWGMGTRRHKVAEIRKKHDGIAYAQLMVYDDLTVKTVNGTCVPSAIYFTAYTFVGQQYVMEEVYNVEWQEDLSRPNGRIKYLDHAKTHFTTSVEAAPVVVQYSPIATNRTLRFLRRDSEKKAAEIDSGVIVSRYPERDGLYAHGDAADIEVVGVGRRLSAGFFAHKHADDDLALACVRRALNFGGDQLELDSRVTIVDDAGKKAGLEFLKCYSGDEDLEDLEDQLAQLIKD